MIPLKIQVQSFIYSFLYGMFFSLALNLNYRFLYQSRKWVKLVITVLFIIDHALLYFIILKHINEGIVHIYFFIMIVIGFMVGNRKCKLLRK